MISLHARRPLNRWDHDSVRPGPVGSVGDVHLTSRLKTSMHGEPIRWGPDAHEYECRLGANISDGSVPAYGDGGRVAALHDSNWGWRDSFRTERGWRHQDLRAPDTATMEMMGGLPQYSWHNTLATVHHARVSGDMFLPLPNGFGPAPGDEPRGGLDPRITDRAGGTMGDPLRYAWEEEADPVPGMSGNTPAEKAAFYASDAGKLAKANYYNTPTGMARAAGRQESPMVPQRTLNPLNGGMVPGARGPIPQNGGWFFPGR